MDSFLKTGKISAASSSLSPKSKGKGSKKPVKSIPWVEKYRPRSVTDVAAQEEVIQVLKSCLLGADLPNLLFYGPPGTGKTSTILAASRDLFGSSFRERVLELNASDERGISVIRDKVKNFAQLTACSKTDSDGKTIPAFKIIILDEADSMTRDAQSALRRTMEKEGRSTKFCLICNYISRIIEPLTSRCAKFRFKPLSDSILKIRMRFIADKESVLLTDDGIEALMETSEGDLRKAITTLQSTSKFNDKVGGEEVRETVGMISNSLLDEIFVICRKNSYEDIENYVNDILLEGYSALQFIYQIFDRVHGNEMLELSEEKKSVFCETLAVNEYRLLEGANEYLQLIELCSVFMRELS